MFVQKNRGYLVVYVLRGNSIFRKVCVCKKYKCFEVFHDCVFHMSVNSELRDGKEKKTDILDWVKQHSSKISTSGNLTTELVLHAMTLQL